MNIEWGELVEVIPLSQCNDSLLYDCDTVIASVTSLDSKYNITVEVHGDVMITYKDEVYRYPSEFPDSLTAMIRDGSAWQNPEIYIDNNNWFEISIYEKDEYLGGEVWDICPDVCSKEQIRAEMIEYAEESFKYWEEDNR